MPKLSLFNDECLNFLKSLEDKSIDMVLCDPPYGLTEANWDRPLDWAQIWEQLHRVCKVNAAVCLFGSARMHYDLVFSNRKDFHYAYTWLKNTYGGFTHAKHKPLTQSEQIAVFYKKQPTYNPQKRPALMAELAYSYGLVKRPPVRGLVRDENYKYKPGDYQSPTDLLYFKTVFNNRRFHVTEKPLELLEFFIKTYTNEGETVLDFCAGSASCGEACYNTGRNFIGCELEPDFFTIAKRRLELLGEANELEQYRLEKPLLEVRRNSKTAQYLWADHLYHYENKIIEKHKASTRRKQASNEAYQELLAAPKLAPYVRDFVAPPQIELKDGDILPQGEQVELLAPV